MKTLKSLLTVSIIISAFLLGHSQETFDLKENLGKHEISLGVADLFTKQDPLYVYPYIYDMVMPTYYPYYYDQYYSNYKPKFALRYKYNFGSFAFRSGIDFSYSTANYDYYYNEQENKQSQLFGNFRFGGEFYKYFNRVRLSYGIDVFVTYSKSLSTSEYINQVWVDGQYVDELVKSENSTTLNELGVSPFIGINYFFTPHLSLGVETNYKVGKYETEYEYKNSGETQKNNQDGIYTGFGPVGIISLNVHF